jgi:hypothetical protein
VFCAGTTGQKHAVEVTGFDGGKRRIGMHRQPAATGHMNTFSQCSHDDLGAGAAKQIDGGDCFYFLKAIREERENVGHAIEETSSDADEHSFLNAVAAIPVLSFALK